LGVLFPFPLRRIELRISSIDVLFYIDDLRGGLDYYFIPPMVLSAITDLSCLNLVEMVSGRGFF